MFVFEILPDFAGWRIWNSYPMMEHLENAINPRRRGGVLHLFEFDPLHVCGFRHLSATHVSATDAFLRKLTSRSA
ncbi:hypothetical protein Y032_0724g1850 [Ancylostoma ceylanicum]|uniref:Uncharacterized protein n=1 Tax=Ancylostoma ceylanicum TaxID=53326 RepID=A0A016WER0_9BILA|nr:hypothetical protein Y032_0724g1850 [Ancylostoma ceylanicum]